MAVIHRAPPSAVVRGRTFALVPLAVLTVLLASLAGCRAPGAAGGGVLGDPIVDTRGVDPAAHAKDMADCQQYADQVGVAERTAGGAAAGAAVGAAVGAVLGDSHSAGRGAGVGAIGGGVRGAASGLRERQQVLRNCLRGRGYRVLN